MYGIPLQQHFEGRNFRNHPAVLGRAEQDCVGIDHIDAPTELLAGSEEVIRTNPIVCVEQHDKCAFERGDSPISRITRAVFFVVALVVNVRILPGKIGRYLGGFVAGGVVDNVDLVIGVAREYGLHSLAQITAVIVTGNDHVPGRREGGVSPEAQPAQRLADS